MAVNSDRVTILMRSGDRENMTYLQGLSGDNVTGVTRRALAFLAAYEKDREKGIDWLRRSPHRDELEIINLL